MSPRNTIMLLVTAFWRKVNAEKMVRLACNNVIIIIPGYHT